MANIESADIVAIDTILDSAHLRKLISLLVKDEIKAHGDNKNQMKRLSDLLTNVTNGNNVSNELTKQTKAPIILINDLRGEDGIGYSEDEKQMRCQLASLYRLMDLHGWTLNIYNHITLRGKGESKEFFINPLGLLYREVTASSLVKINLEGHTLDPGSTVFGVNKAGWNLHAALHDGRDDIRCIVHTHNPDVIAVGCLNYGLLPINQEAVELLDESRDSLSRGVRYHNYWGISVTKEEWNSLKEDIGPYSKVLFLRNHGVIVCGVDFVETWILTKRIINACENQMRLLKTKGEAALLSMEYKTFQKADDSIDSGEESLLKAQRIHSAELEFEAMMRMLDNAGYHTGYTYCHGNLLREGCGINYENGNMVLDSTMADTTDLGLEEVNENGNRTNRLVG